MNKVSIEERNNLCAKDQNSEWHWGLQQQQHWNPENDGTMSQFLRENY